jgi:hypothetical protein
VEHIGPERSHISTIYLQYYVLQSTIVSSLSSYGPGGGTEFIPGFTRPLGLSFFYVVRLSQNVDYLDFGLVECMVGV